MKRQAFYEVTWEDLESLLNLDSDHRVIGVSVFDSNNKRGSISVLVTGPLLPEVFEGEYYPYVPNSYLDDVKKGLF